MPEAAETPVPARMRGVRTMGHGGLDMLEYSEDVATPSPGRGEVLIRVGACGMNNTDINTRTAWYSKSVTQATDAGGAEGFDGSRSDDSTWGGEGLVLPRIQGADVAGTIVAVGARVIDASPAFSGASATAATPSSRQCRR